MCQRSTLELAIWYSSPYVQEKISLDSLGIPVLVWQALASALFTGSFAAESIVQSHATESEIQPIENSIQIANLRVFDVMNGIQRTFYFVGQALEIATTLKSQSGYGGHVVIVTEVRDASDVTVMLHTQSTVLLTGPQTVRSPWIPMADGEYTVRSMVLQSLDNAVMLSSLVAKEVAVDKIRVQGYYQSNEDAISIGTADDKVKQIFNGQEMILSHVRASGVAFPGCERHCGIMYLDNGNHSEGVELGIDLAKKRVISIRISPQLVSENPAEVFR